MHQRNHFQRQHKLISKGVLRVGEDAPPPLRLSKRESKKGRKKGGKGKIWKKDLKKQGEKQKVWSPFHNLDISRYLVGWGFAWVGQKKNSLRAGNNFRAALTPPPIWFLSAPLLIRHYVFYMLPYLYKKEFPHRPSWLL